MRVREHLRVSSCSRMLLRSPPVASASREQRHEETSWPEAPHWPQDRVVILRGPMEGKQTAVDAILRPGFLPGCLAAWRSCRLAGFLPGGLAGLLGTCLAAAWLALAGWPYSNLLIPWQPCCPTNRLAQDGVCGSGGEHESQVAGPCHPLSSQRTR